MIQASLLQGRDPQDILTVRISMAFAYVRTSLHASDMDALVECRQVCDIAFQVLKAIRRAYLEDAADRVTVSWHGRDTFKL